MLTDRSRTLATRVARTPDALSAAAATATSDGGEGGAPGWGRSHAPSTNPPARHTGTATAEITSRELNARVRPSRQPVMWALRIAAPCFIAGPCVSCFI